MQCHENVAQLLGPLIEQPCGQEGIFGLAAFVERLEHREGAEGVGTDLRSGVTFAGRQNGDRSRSCCRGIGIVRGSILFLEWWLSGEGTGINQA